MEKRPLLSCVLAFAAGIFLSDNTVGIAFIAILFILCEIGERLSNNIRNITLPYRISPKAKVCIFICLFCGAVFLHLFDFFRVEQVKRFDNKEKEIIGIISNEVIDKGNYYEYFLKNCSVDGKKLLSNILVKSKEQSEYGNKVKINAVLTLPNGARNSNTFDYAKYLKTLNVYITADAVNTEPVSENNLFLIEKISYFIRKKVSEFSEATLDTVNSGILTALTVGDDTKIGYESEEAYKKAGMLHLLVVSGGHTVFLIALLKYVFSFLGISKKISKILYITVIFLYIFITGATPSIIRAGIGIIIVITADLLGRKNDGFTTLGAVAFILLINNPNTLFSMSFLLSFGGVLGIMICYPKIRAFLNFIPTVIAEPLSLTLAAQIFVTPITIYGFNVIYLGGIISNILTLNLSGFIMMGGIVLFFVYLLLPPLVVFPMKIISFLISLMNKIAEIFSEADFLICYVITPNAISVLVYYILLLYFFSEKTSVNEKSLVVITFPQIPASIRKNLRRIIAVCGVVSILVLNLKIIDFDKSLKISMIDVGHGDSILITTPNDKYILIDTGDKFYGKDGISDSGENTIVPYLLKHGISKVDLIVLTHMDSDHIGGYESIVKAIAVKTLGLSVNSGKKEEYENIRNIAREKAISIKSLEKGDRFEIDGVKFNVLMPERKEKISNENNDSVVLLMEYNGKKVLFTGDLEKEGEAILINSGEDLDIDVLKVGHHGSVTSSSEEFIRETSPEIALISVGNRFKSIPGKEVLNRLSSVHSKVYRTDEMGEINVIIKNGKIFTQTTY